MWMWHIQTVASKWASFPVVLVSSWFYSVSVYVLLLTPTEASESLPVLAFHLSVPSLVFLFSPLHLWISVVSRSSTTVIPSWYLALCSVLFVSSSWMFYMLMTHKVLLRLYLQLVYQVFPFERLKEFHSLFGLLLPNFHLLYFSCFIIIMLKSWSHVCDMFLLYFIHHYCINIQHYSLG